VVLLKPGNIRSNLVLVADDGQAHSDGKTRAHLYEWIESLPWRDVVSQRVLRRP
jgi:hypothetical protein